MPFRFCSILSSDFSALEAGKGRPLNKVGTQQAPSSGTLVPNPLGNGIYTVYTAVAYMYVVAYVLRRIFFSRKVFYNNWMQAVMLRQP